MQFRNFECVFPTLDDIKVTLIPARDGGELRAGETSKGVKKQAIEYQGSVIGEDDASDVGPGYKIDDGVHGGTLKEPHFP